MLSKNGMINYLWELYVLSNLEEGEAKYALGAQNLDY